jgi:CRISPR-associated Cas5-like protein
MEWIKAEIEFPSTFSYRMPDTSSQFAIPALLPGPSTIKLGLVATTILQTRNMSEGEKIFESLKLAEIKFQIPEKIAVFTPLIKRLKAKSVVLKKRGFEQTFGIRGYVFYSESLKLYLGLPEDSKVPVDTFIRTLTSLRRLGTSDSLLTFINIVNETPPQSIKIVEPLKEIKATGVIQLVKDISEEAHFNDVNPFSQTQKKKKKNPFVTKYYILPIRIIKQGRNWMLYQLKV